MKAFAAIRERTVSAVVRGELTTDPHYRLLRTEVGALAALIARAEVLKRGDSHSVLVLELSPQGPSVLCKFFPEQGLAGRLKQWCRLDRPARMHRRLRQWADKDLPISHTLGHVAVSGLGAAWFSSLLTGRSLLHWTGEHLPPTAAERLALLMPALNAMLALHRGGLVHGDFKWGNILSDEGTCQLVDVDSLRQVPVAGFGRGKARDLARFVLDCEEAGVPMAEIAELRRYYARHAAVAIAQLDRWVAPPLERLRQRHRQRYGEGYRLVLSPEDSP